MFIGERVVVKRSHLNYSFFSSSMYNFHLFDTSHDYTFLFNNINTRPIMCHSHIQFIISNEKKNFAQAKRSDKKFISSSSSSSTSLPHSNTFFVCCVNQVIRIRVPPLHEKNYCVSLLIFIRIFRSPPHNDSIEILSQ
jgi:hypothetical protein